MKTIRITAVSYSNTLPLIYGIRNSGILHNYRLDLAVPSECANRLLLDETDLSLVPVGAFSLFKDYHLVSDTCIGAVGNVKSVLLLCNDPVESLRTIYLDSDSRTSVNLVKVLAHHLWKTSVEWKSLESMPTEQLCNHEGMVLIGDKTFGITSRFKYSYDLAGEWHRLTQLPFVFAAWIATRPLPDEFVRQFESALAWGINHIPESTELSVNPLVSKQELITYLQQDISFHLDDQKKEGLMLFLRYLKELR